MKVGAVKEILPGERRVALVPDTVTKLVAAKLEVSVQAGAIQLTRMLSGASSRAMERMKMIWPPLDVA